MPTMNVLNSNEREIFEIPPLFNNADRMKLFDFPLKIIRFMKTLRSPTNQVYFLVMFGYFKATKRFFSSKNFHPKDIAFVASQFGFSLRKIKINSYDRITYHRHKKFVLEYYGFREFDKEARQIVIEEISSIIRSQVKAKLIMIRAIEVLMSRKIEIPSYTILANLIVDEMKKHKHELVRIIESRLTSETKDMLDGLFQKEDNQSSKVKRYKLTLLKKFNQSTRPKKIKENIEDLQTLKELFQTLEGLLKELNLTYEGIRYYAHSVIKSEIFQVSRRADEDRYLHLIAFVVHQFFRLQDILIDIFLIAVQNNINTVTREHKEIYYEKRKEKNESVKKVVSYLDENLLTISSIRKIINTPGLSNEEKIERIQAVLSEYEKQDSEVKEHISYFKEESEKVLKNADFYCIVEAKSIKLQNRASDIIKNIEFDADTSFKSVIEAIDYYKKKDGNIDKKTPMNFLQDDEQDIIFDNEGKFKVSLYKSLLFAKIADALKAGKLNLKYSYKYRSLNEYLISRTLWEKSKDEYIQRTELTDFTEPKIVLQTLEHALDKQYNSTNKNILNKKNEFINFHKNGAFQLSTPKIETEESEVLSEFFPKTYISLALW